MDKTRYELYTKGDYDLFLSNLKYLLETVESDRIRVRVPKIPKLNTYADVRSNYEILKSMGFSEIEIFDYIEIDKHEKISEIALKNKQDFVDVVNNNFIKNYIITEIILKIAPLLDFHIKTSVFVTAPPPCALGCGVFVVTYYRLLPRNARL